MGKIKSVILVVILVVTAMHESMGFVRVGRAEERNKDKAPSYGIPYEEPEAVESSEREIESELGKLLQRRAVDRLALMKLLIDAYNKREREPYLVISKRGRDKLRNTKEKLSTLLQGKSKK